MTETTKNKALTANRLDDGSIVYLKVDGGKPVWTADLAKATAFADDESEQMESLAASEVTKNVVVSPYVIDIAENSAPTSAKETVRASGPSVKYGHAARGTD